MNKRMKIKDFVEKILNISPNEIVIGKNYDNVNNYTFALRPRNNGLSYSTSTKDKIYIFIYYFSEGMFSLRFMKNNLCETVFSNKYNLSYVCNYKFVSTYMVDPFTNNDEIFIIYDKTKYIDNFLDDIKKLIFEMMMKG